MGSERLMARYARTIQRLDTLLVELQRVARDLYLDGRKTDAGALRESRDAIREVRNDLLASDHDAEKARA